MKTTLPLLIIAAIFTGCLPFPHGVYYKPSYDDPTANRTLAYCHGQAGPPTGLTFKLNDHITVSVRTYEPYKSFETGDRVAISLELSQGDTLEFLTPNVDVYQNDRKVASTTQMRVYSSATIPATDTVSLSQMCPVSPQAIHANGDEAITEAHLSFFDSKQPFAPTRLGVIFPTIVTDKTSLRLDKMTLHLEETKYSRFYLSDAMADKRTQRYQTCLRDTPEKSCQNLLGYSSKSFEQLQGDLNLSGNLDLWNSVTRGNLTLQSRSAQWHLSTNQIMLIDEATQQTQTRFIDTMYLHCGSYTLPITTPVHTATTLHHAKTAIFVEMPIDTEVFSSIEIRLPSANINGKRYDFKPIRLKKSVFDFGIYPFNC